MPSGSQWEKGTGGRCASPGLRVLGSLSCSVRGVYDNVFVEP